MRLSTSPIWSAKLSGTCDVDPYIQKALVDMGLAGPHLASLQNLNPQEVEKALDVLKKEARRLGRRLLGKYHPDRNAADEEAPKHFQAVKLVLEKLDTLRVIQPRPSPVVSYKVTYYPPTSPHGGSVKTVRTGYFTYQHTTGAPGVGYDARRVVTIKPR